MPSAFVDYSPCSSSPSYDSVCGEVQFYFSQAREDIKRKAEQEHIKRQKQEEQAKIEREEKVSLYIYLLSLTLFFQTHCSLRCL